MLFPSEMAFARSTTLAGIQSGATVKRNQLALVAAFALRTPLTGSFSNRRALPS